MKANKIETATQVISAIHQLWQARSIREVREFIGQLETEDEFFKLIKLADQADLHTYSHLLATQAHKRFQTLRTFTWQCARLLETGRSLEAEERMSSRLQDVESGNDSEDELAAAHQLLLRIFAQLNRLPEAKAQLTLYEKHKGFVWPDLEGFYFIHSGEWDKAERVLEKEINSTATERNHYVRLLYADVLAMTGRQKESLAVLEQGQQLAPDSWTFRADIIRTLFFLGHYQKAVEAIALYTKENPYHGYRKSWIHMTADCLYKLERWEALKDWVQQHQSVLEKTVFGKNEIRQDAERREIRLTPNIQKLNYCVPASLSLMLEAYDMKKGQDEIAEHVFDVTGSDLQTTLAYMESLGFTGRYFKGTLDLYKKFIDAGIPVLLSMLIENTAHVQVVVGYDDRLQALLIQDPNDLGPFLLSYQDLADTYKLTDGLSMVFLLPTQESFLTLVNKKEHHFFTQLFEIWADEETGDEKDRAVEFLTHYPEERYGAVVGLVTQYSEKAKELHASWLEKLYRDLGKKDAEVALVAAHMHFRKEEYAQALVSLEFVSEKKSSYALFLKAAILMSQDEHMNAVPLLKKSIELDHYQPIAYSHLARCYLEIDKIHQAFKWSGIALDQEPTDVYARITHSLIQFDLGAYEKALSRFRELSQEQPDDGYFIYETGRCLVALGEEESAIQAFERAKKIDAKEPFAYLRIAEMHMDAKQWQQAETVLQEGIDNSDKTDLLHMYIGHIAMEQERFKDAEVAYRKSQKLEPSDLYIITHIAHALLKQNHIDQLKALVMEHTEKDDTAYFNRTAAMLWEESEDDTVKALALTLLEDGLERLGVTRYSLAEQYAEFGEAPQFRSRILDRFKTIRANKADSVLLCFEGSVYEMEDHQRFAQVLYQQAIELDGFYMAHFHLARLAEQLDEWTKARDHFAACAKTEPSFTPAQEGLMRCYVALEDNNRALKAALHVLEHEPLSVELHELFELIDNESKRQQIEEVLEKVSAQVPEEWLLSAKSHLAENQGDVARAESLLLKAEASNGALSSRYQHVQFCVRQGDHKKAVMLLEELIVEDPTEETFYAEYVRLLVELRKTSRLHKQLKKRLSGEALAMAETYSATQLVMWLEAEEGDSENLFGKLRGKSRRFMMLGNIIALYNDAMKKYKQSVVPVLHLAEFYMARDMPGEAVRVLGQFLKHQDHAVAEKLWLEATLQQANLEQSDKLLDKATKLAEKLSNKQPEDVDVWLWQGDIEVIRGNVDGAEKRYERAIALNPYRSDGYVRLMHVLAESRGEKPASFEKRLPEALRVNEWICLTLATMSITTGDSVSAIARLHALQRELPSYLPASYELARATMAGGQVTQAKQLLTQLFKKEGGEQFVATAIEEELFEDILEDVFAVEG
ncbi:tetratricopeptide repeat protein [Planococcus versutus]|uniref:Peptidase C39 domain-containing protein n=1 Tax=Planococcus versutus TaxID=1302659 RepID=A0A1B1S365_9BACL|nr:tetratricopeptide repeat protein [Planococcus versutus]ANU27589.1 hypothetical protein I858_011395 [Planococcus versutus]